MKYLTTEFSEFYEKFVTTKQWFDMKMTVEDSPYHREDNVAVHTNMVLDQVTSIAGIGKATFYVKDVEDKHFSNTDLNVLYVAALFHDVGKPASKEVVTRDDGTTYNRFAGHEQKSARMFNEFFFNNRDMFDDFRFSRNQLLYIQWLIENHLPYSLKKKDKVIALAKDIIGMADFAEVNPNIFFCHLLSDTTGRIPDVSNTDAVIAWSKEMGELCSVEDKKDRVTSDKRMTIIVGPSGAGKSTLVRSLVKEKELDGREYAIYSLDNLRVFLYSMYDTIAEKCGATDMEGKTWNRDALRGVFKQYDLSTVLVVDNGNYRDAYDFCVKNESLFTMFADVYLQYCLSLNCDIIADNTNTSKKRRAKYINMARQKNFEVYCEYIMCDLKTVLAAQKTRGDKEVPDQAVAFQYNSLTVPSQGGEFDVVNVNVRYS